MESKLPNSELEPEYVINQIIRGLLIISKSLLGKYILRRIQIIPSRLTSLGLVKEYLIAVFFPMDPIRNIITQFVEVKLAKDRDSQMESALRAAYDGTGYWLDVTPRSRESHRIEKRSIVGYGSRVKDLITSLFHKHTIRIPTECTSVVKITKEDVPLLLKHKFIITQSRIVEDTTIITKICYVALALYWLSIIYKVSYYIWTLQYVPRDFLPITLFHASAIIPLFYTFGKCVAPVFVSIQSDELYLRKDFIDLAENKRASDDVISDKVSSTKDAIQREVHIRFALERIIGSLIYLVVVSSTSYIFMETMQYNIEGIFPNPVIPDPLTINHLSLIKRLVLYSQCNEAGMHVITCLNELVEAYYGRLSNSRIWGLWKFIISVVHFISRIFALV